MADQDRRDDGPSLEMPSFSLRGRRKAEPVAEPHEEPVALAEPAEPGRRTRRRSAPRTASRTPALRLPTLPGVPAALVTGAAVGLVTVLLTWGVLNGCEAVRGTSSCGGGPGLLLLLAVLVLVTYVGGWLLRALDVSDPGSTSFLGVALMAVLAMLFLAGSLFEWWMVVALPVLAMATYALAWWVTTRVVETD